MCADIHRPLLHGKDGHRDGRQKTQPGYKKLGDVGYDHATVNHSEVEYASGPDNETHSNNCECRVGLLRWWIRKHCGVSKWHLESYVKAFWFVHNHHT